MTDEPPRLRRPLGVMGIMVFIALYALLAASLAAPILALPVLVQTPIWLVLGIAWVLPLRPVLRWIETGKFR